MEENKKNYQNSSVLSFVLMVTIAISLLWAVKEFIPKKNMDTPFEKVYFAEDFDYRGENTYGI